MRARQLQTAALIAVAAVLAGCSLPSDALSSERAHVLVDRAHSSGIAPSLDVAAAKALYGDNAQVVCGPLTDDPVTVNAWARINRSIPAAKTRDLVKFDRLVVATYCNQDMNRFDQLLNRLHYTP